MRMSSIQAEVSKARIRPNLIGFGSGMGGHGKTTLATNVAAVLARRRLRVLILDADGGRRTASERLGEEFLPSLADVAVGRESMQAALGQRRLEDGSVIDFAQCPSWDPANLTSILGATGQADALIDQLVWAYDCVLLDAASGIRAEVMTALSACSHCLIVTSDDPSAMTDAYAMNKVMASWAPDVRCHNVACRVQTRQAGDGALEAIGRACEHHLQVSPGWGGVVRHDDRAQQAARCGDLLVEIAPESAAARDIETLAERVEGILCDPPAR